MMDDSTSTSTTTTTIINKINPVVGSTVPKEKKVIVKRDIVRKKEPVNIVFCGHVDAGKSTIGGQLM
jgi:GTPase